jgi:hypothetical protein
MRQVSVKEALVQIILEVAGKIGNPMVQTMLPLLLRPLETMPESQAREVALMIVKYSRKLEEALGEDAVGLDKAQ